MPDKNGFIDIYFEELTVSENLPAGEMHLLKFGGKKISESRIKKFVPVQSISVFNSSTEEVKIIINETESKGFRVPPKSSRAFDKYPCWDIAVRNMGTETIEAGDIIINLINDLEGVARYNAYAKMKGRTG